MPRDDKHFSPLVLKTITLGTMQVRFRKTTGSAVLQEVSVVQKLLRMSLAICVRTEMYDATLKVLEMETVSLRICVWPTWGSRIRFFLSKFIFFCILFLSVHVRRVTTPVCFTPFLL